ncbi:MAG: class I SAM-dependent methyltransferase [Flavobacteriales bacterium]|nr:class I SAM-dependent methyltransferase [Flavobacteriales bacterium]
MEKTFYDSTPFEYGYSSKEEILENMNPNLKKVIEKSKGKIITDIGCGCGRNLIYASKYASKLIGVDLSKQSLEFAKNFIQSDNLELVLGNNLEIPLDSDFSNLVVSDGVVHHTGDTVGAFKECVRVLKPNGLLYLAVYKKYRYYPFLYKYVGVFLRILNKTKVGNFIMENTFVLLHFLMYRIFKKQKLRLRETRNIFYDYFITPLATFHSKKDVQVWIDNNNCSLEKYDRTNGNCHVFIIKKGE